MVGVHACGSRRTPCENCFPPSIMCIPGIQFRLSGLAANPFTGEAILFPRLQFTGFCLKFSHWALQQDDCHLELTLRLASDSSL